MPESNRFELIARAGYVARGLVYLLLGMVCLASLFSGIGGQDASGALSLLRDTPGGGLVLLAIAAGLMGFALWRLAQSLLDADGVGNAPARFLVRAAQFGSAIAHAGLALLVVRIALVGGGGGNGEAGIAAWLMRQPSGPWAVGGVALVIAGVGLGQIYRGVARTYCQWIELEPRHERLLVVISSFGLSARGILFIIAGGLFLYAAVTVEPQRAGSIGEALDWLRRLPWLGVWLYLLAAAGLVAFGLFNFIQALYRTVDVSLDSAHPHANDPAKGNISAISNIRN